jgi:hypothetical protein
VKINNGKIARQHNILYKYIKGMFIAVLMKITNKGHFCITPQTITVFFFKNYSQKNPSSFGRAKLKQT